MVNQWLNTHLKAVKVLTFMLGLLPLLLLIYKGFNGGLGANPVEFITRDTGTWALNFLWITLAVTPVRKLFNFPILLKLRRMLGLYSFFYAFCHFLIWFWLDHSFSWSEMLHDVVKRPFITVGFVALLLLIPLALTSWNRAIKWLGGKNWQKLHYLVYPIGTLAILHFYWMKSAKNNLGEPYIYLAILVVLLGYRCFMRVGK